MGKKEVGKLPIFGWVMYDLADTIFSALFVTLFFPLLVTLKGGPPFHVGLPMGAALLLAGILVPFVGAVADITQRKKLILLVFTILTCVFTFVTGFFSLVPMLIAAVLATLFYHASLDVYDALLVNVSSRKNVGWISGLGTAAGYGGTLVGIAIAYLVGSFYGYETVEGIRIVFILTALFYLLFASFTFALVPEKSATRIRLPHLKDALRRVVGTLTRIHKIKSVAWFLLSSFLYMDAANTAIIFLFLYAQDQLGLSVFQFLPIYVVMAVAAGIGSLIAGKVTDRVGHKKTLYAVLVLWTLLMTMLYVKTNYTTFVVTGIVGGALLGAIWTITRPLLISITPAHKVSELLGYQGLTEKFSGILGPVLYGYIATAFGFRPAVIVIIVLFLAGAIVLRKVKAA